MRKNYVLYSALALGMMGSFASCSSDDDFTMSGVDNGGIVADADQVIEIAVESAGGGLQTRAAGRPLNSSEANQTITNLKVIVVNESNQVVADTLYKDWQNASAVYDDASGHGRKVRFPLFGSNKLEAQGTYTIYAIGYDKNTAYTVQPQGESAALNLNTYLTAVGDGKTNSNAGLDVANGEETKANFYKNLIIKNGDNNAAEELFAGSAQITIGENGKFSKGVTLHRQVAGVFSYLKNVPYMVTIDKGAVTETADHLQLVAVKKNKNFVLGEFYKYALTENGTATGDANDPADDTYLPDNQLQNVVNGDTEVDGTLVVYDINLKDWFTEIKDENNDGLIDRCGFEIDDATGLLVEKEDVDGKITDLNWKKPNRFEKVTLVKGSVFGGEFIIPFLSDPSSDDYTFKLRLVSLKADGKTVNKNYREWSVSLPINDVLTTDDLINTWEGSDWSGEQNLGTSESAKKYSVLRNHLYGVGVKNSDGNGDDQDDPTPDDEDPEDLSTKQDLLLQVCDNWELIHKMEIE